MVRVFDTSESRTARVRPKSSGPIGATTADCGEKAHLSHANFGEVQRVGDFHPLDGINFDDLSNKLRKEAVSHCLHSIVH